LEFLTNAKTWYVDATFKNIKQPFTQLFSIHAFVKEDGELMQAPLAFVVLSRRRRKDYKRVFCALIAALPRRPRVQAVVPDFEAAVWSRKVLPGVLQRGCAFHFSQAVWRNIQAVDLQCAYTSDERTNRVCRQTIALPFLPANIIADEFQTLHTASDDPRVAQHLQYMERPWISSTTWLPTTWSVFRQPVRTKLWPTQLIQVDLVAVRRSCTCTAQRAPVV